MAVAAALLLHGALALGLGWQGAVLPSPTGGTLVSRSEPEPGVLWLRLLQPAVPVPSIEPPTQASLQATTEASLADLRPAPELPAPERPLESSRLSDPNGQQLDLRYPDIALSQPQTRLTMELQLDASGSVRAARPAAGAVDAQALVEHVQAELDGARVRAAVSRLCLHLSLDEREAQLRWRLTEPVGNAPCRDP